MADDGKLVRAELFERLKDPEDSFVERKLEGASLGELRRTLVAFANSVPPDREAVLYLGVHDNGTIAGVNNVDSLQKKIDRICNDDCYPPIHFTSEVVRLDEGLVLAVVVPPSAKKPHFGGPALIRRGSKSVVVTEDLYEDLITSRHAKAEELLRYKGKIVSVMSPKNQLGRPEFAQLIAGSTLQVQVKSYECKVEVVNPFFAKFIIIGSGSYFSEPLQNIEISYDDQKRRPLLVIRLDGA